jgi:MscS family membrane protein
LSGYADSAPTFSVNVAFGLLLKLQSIEHQVHKMTGKNFMLKRLNLFILTIGLALPSLAQDQSVRELVDKVEETEQIMEAKLAEIKHKATDASTPLSMLVNMQKAKASGDIELLLSFVDLRYLPEEVASQDPLTLLQQLTTIWNQQKILDLASVSDETSGHLDDGLPSYRDLLGRLEGRSGTVPIYMQRVPDGKGGQVWKISNATMALVPKLWEEFGYGEFTKSVADTLPEFTFLGLYNWQIAYVLVYLILAWPIISLVVSFTRRLISDRIQTYRDPLTRFLDLPLRLFLYIAPIQPLVLSLNVPATSRIIFNSSGLLYLAFAFLATGIVNLIIARQARSLEESDKAYIIPLLKPITMMIKIILWLTVVLLWADNAGYDMTTIIAGLGIGSVAVALAAQKTLENLIGAITLYVARPVKPGDFCRFGSSLGTVEEMGLRAISIRTLEGTLLNIPNSVFSSGEVENYSERQQIRYYRFVRLRLDTTPDQVRYILAELRRTFLSHPELDQTSVSIRFQTIEADAILIRIDARIQTTDFQENLKVCEDLNLRIIDTVKSSGSWFAVPTQSLRWEEANDIDNDQAAIATGIVQDWRQESSLPFPDYREEEVNQMRNSLEYPVPGSSSSRERSKD